MWLSVIGKISVILLAYGLLLLVLEKRAGRGPTLACRARQQEAVAKGKKRRGSRVA